MSTVGQIVLLNGVPRSGKSSIIEALQQDDHSTWINLGVDTMMATLPDHLRPGIGLRPGGERPDLEPLVQQLYRALFDSIAAYARAGFNVVSDLGIHDDYSRPLDVLIDAVDRLCDLPVLFVGVRCPLDIIMQRRNADASGTYLAGPTIPPPVAKWQEAVHRPGIYDLEVDTSRLTPQEAAELITRTLSAPPRPSAFARITQSG